MEHITIIPENTHRFILQKRSINTISGITMIYSVNLSKGASRRYVKIGEIDQRNAPVFFYINIF